MPFKRLKNGRVLTVDREETATGSGDSAHDQFTSDDEGLLVGQSHIFTCFYGG